MLRVIEPLARMGAQFSDETLPLEVRGAENPLCIEYELPVPSAQIKSAILLAGLNARGRTTVIEPVATRDHTEIMLRHVGAKIDVEIVSSGRRAVHIHGHVPLSPGAADIPGDPSSAAFIIAAALLKPGSELMLPGICINPRRTGFLRAVEAMGTDISYRECPLQNGERVADLHLRGGEPLTAIDVAAESIPDMIDEIPVLSILAACARGTTRLHGLGELRYKESDRLAMIAGGLKACGVRVETESDALIIHGNGHPPEGGATIESGHDHRIAMSFLVLGIASAQPVRVSETASISTSFPGFSDALQQAVA